VTVTNTGGMAGDEIVQLYTACEGSRVERAMKELKGFARVHLAAGESKRVEIALPVDSLAYYDEGSAGWVVEKGSYAVLAGPSEQELAKVGFNIV